jgi:endonuclease/exonuclease/phosphatase family metal-dependent hydrolase
MNLASWAEGKPTLQRFAELSELLGQVSYTDARKAKMAKLMIELGLERRDDARFVILRRNKGQLLRRPKAGGIEILAEGRADWAGSLELVEEPVDEIAMRLTARVIADLNADVLAIVETESRLVLKQFNDLLVKAEGGEPMRHVMVIDGNDGRGIDVGLMTSGAYPIGVVRSHVDDRDAKGRSIFSRDCPEYAVQLADGKTLWVLVNHLKSKGHGKPADNDARRLAQAQRVKAIYEARVSQGDELVAVVGDLNDTPDSHPLKPLLANTDLKDASEHPAFDDGGFPGTYKLCNAKDKIDYLLLSPKLWSSVNAGGVMRRGMWPGSKPARWTVYPELNDAKHAASDHAALWVDLKI